LSKVFSRASLRRDARSILKRALATCAVSRILPARIEVRGRRLTGAGIDHRLPEGDRTLILAAGKAAATMARSFLRILPRGLGFGGLVVIPADSEIPPQSLHVRKSSHPYPTLRSQRAGLDLMRAVRSARPGDTVIYLVSGGASALAAVPLPGLLDIAEKRILHRSLIESGLGIRDINVVRRHFSAIKGGRLLALAPRADHLTFLLSDVAPGNPESVGGGPTLPDPSTWSEARSILAESGVLADLPAPLRRRLDRKAWPETPKPGDRHFARHRWSILADSSTLVAAAEQAARRLGYETRVLTLGEGIPAEALVEDFFSFLERRRGAGSLPRCLLAGGEVRRESRGWKGRGGRAQDFAAAAALRLSGSRRRLLLAAGSDGKDGNSPAAGALADGSTVARAARLGFDLAASRSRGDTYPVFAALGDALMTGATGNNLRDLYLLLESPRG
jgi:glycerate-2-kinase